MKNPHVFYSPEVCFDALLHEQQGPRAAAPPRCNCSPEQEVPAVTALRRPEDPRLRPVSATSRRWQLASGQGACSEGLGDLRAIWNSQTTIEERPGYTLVQVTSCSWQSEH